LTALAPRSKLKRSSIGWSIPAPFAAPAAAAVGPIVFYSGALGLDRKGQLVGTADSFDGPARSIVRSLQERETCRGFAAQCWACFERLGETAQAVGSRLEDLLKITVYLRERADFAVFEAIRPHFIADKALPALECVHIFAPGPVSEATVQIEAIGAIDEAPTR
jgi:enamine deaminase RidA (YjgF/YER057c/UK114 family)